MSRTSLEREAEFFRKLKEALGRNRIATCQS